MWEYTDKVKDHFFNPHNVGEMENPDGVGEVGSLACGDALKLTFKLDKNGRIAEAKFKTFGCASAIATSSVLTDMIKGLTLEEAERFCKATSKARDGPAPVCVTPGGCWLLMLILSCSSHCPQPPSGESRSCSKLAGESMFRVECRRWRL